MAGNESQREKRPKGPESAHDLLDNITPNIDGAALTPDQSDKSPGAGERSPALGVSIEAASETEHQAPALLYPVVAFGASAGGLQAFREILENLDPNTLNGLCPGDPSGAGAEELPVGDRGTIHAYACPVG